MCPFYEYYRIFVSEETVYRCFPRYFRCKMTHPLRHAIKVKVHTEIFTCSPFLLGCKFISIVLYLFLHFCKTCFKCHSIYEAHGFITEAGFIIEYAAMAVKVRTYGNSQQDRWEKDYSKDGCRFTQGQG